MDDSTVVKRRIIKLGCSNHINCQNSKFEASISSSSNRETIRLLSANHRPTSPSVHLAVSDVQTRKTS